MHTYVIGGERSHRGTTASDSEGAALADTDEDIGEDEDEDAAAGVLI